MARWQFYGRIRGTGKFPTPECCAQGVQFVPARELRGTLFRSDAPFGGDSRPA